MTIVIFNKEATNHVNVNVGRIIHNDSQKILMLIDTKNLTEKDMLFFEQDGLIVEDTKTREHNISLVSPLDDRHWLVTFEL